MLIAKATAEVHYGHAEWDKSMPPEAIAELGHVLEESGLIYVNEVYEGTTHGDTMADTARYDEAATERHFAALNDLLARTLRA